MTWNYRVIEFTDGDDTWQAIHEVYYDDAGKPSGYTEKEVGVSISTVEGGEPTGDDLAGVYMRMGEAFGKPVLKPENFPRSFEPDPIMRAIDLG